MTMTGNVCYRLEPHASMCALEAESLPISARGDPCVSLEKGAEKRDILITDSVADLLHGAMVALQEALGSGDPQLLQVHQRAVSGGLLKAPDEIAEAHAHAPGSSFEGKTSTKILVQPLLCARDAVVAVLGLKWN